MSKNIPENFDAYISCYPNDIQQRLQEIRTIVKTHAPLAQEVISYGMPAFKLNGILIWFAVHTKHIGFYPKASAIEVFASELVDYKTSKGAIQFPMNKAFPTELITKIIQFRIKENLQTTKKR